MSNETPVQSVATSGSQPNAVPQDSASFARADNELPQKRLIEVIGRKLVVILAVGSVLGATALCLIGVFYPTTIPSQTSRFFLCLLASFLFSVFVFTLYPSDYKLDIGKMIRIPFVLVGPAALWIAFFLFLWYMLPREDMAGKVFGPGSAGDQLPYSTSWMLNWTPARPVYYKLKLTDDQNSDDADLLAAFYVQFDEAHNEFTAEIGTGRSSEEIDKRYTVTFSRGATTYTLKPLVKEIKK
jgi:hypothetical protein